MQLKIILAWRLATFFYKAPFYTEEDKRDEVGALGPTTREKGKTILVLVLSLPPPPPSLSVQDERKPLRVLRTVLVLCSYIISYD